MGGVKKDRNADQQVSTVFDRRCPKIAIFLGFCKLAFIREVSAGHILVFSLSSFLALSIGAYLHGNVSFSQLIKIYITFFGSVSVMSLSKILK